MDKVNLSPLYDKMAEAKVIGGFMIRPQLLLDGERYKITINDFSDKGEKIAFGAIYNLAQNGATSILPADIVAYLAQYESQLEYYTQNGVDTWVQLAYESMIDVDAPQFEYYYERVKKFSVLRGLRDKGIDTSDLFDDDFLKREDSNAKLNQMTIEDMLQIVRNKIQEVENENHRLAVDTGTNASAGIRNLVETLKAEPELGVEINGSILDYAARGCRLGKMYLYSSNSGGGKSRTMVSNACRIAYPYISDGKIVMPTEMHPVLYIATEQQADEIQTMILAYISGVNEEKILLGDYSPLEASYIEQAIKIMEKYANNFIIESVPNPSIASLKAMITNYILQDKIEYIFYDYIFTSGGLIGEYSKAGLREDVILMMISNTLKEIAATYNVFIMSGTQLNGTYEGKTIRNANMIRGSKAVADKVDLGMIGIRAPQEEIDAVRDYCMSKGLPIPNIVIDIYKNRRGRMCDIKIFRKFDYGTLRLIDVCATTNTYEILTDLRTVERESAVMSFDDFNQ